MWVDATGETAFVSLNMCCKDWWFETISKLPVMEILKMTGGSKQYQNFLSWRFW